MYLIQDNLFYARNEVNLLLALDRLGYEYSYFKQIPFVDELQFQEPPTSPVIMFGSVKSARIAQKYDLHPCSFFNNNHRYELYSQHYRDNLINWGARVQRFADPIQEDLFFCRPTEDTKTFTGKVFTQQEWLEFLHTTATNGHTTTLNTDTPIMVCKPQHIQQEVRCFVVDGEIITASFYKIGSQIHYKECQDQDILDFAQDMVKTFALARAFVIDICRTESGLKIVECGCINCAGFYNINIQKLLHTLTETFLQ